MTIRATWDNPDKTTLRYIHYGHWTWKEMDAAVEAAQTMFLSLPYHVDVIVDLRESCMPEGNAMLEAARTIPLIPGQNNTLIFVGDPTMSQATYETMRKLYRIRQVREQVHFTPSMDKARALLFKLKPVP